MFKDIPEATYWWQVTPALPDQKESRAYYTLRRAWGDHTINSSNPARGYYRWGKEDNLTPGLFQIWGVFSERDALRSLLAAASVPVRGALQSVCWSYSHEEAIQRGSFPGVKGGKLIADVFIHFVDDDGRAILALETKRPGSSPDQGDANKLFGYTNLPSVRSILRRHGLFVVGEKSAAQAAALAPSFPVLTWETMRELQMAEARTRCLPVTAEWIDRAYARCGIGKTPAPRSAGGGEHADEAAFEAILDLDVPDREKNFLLGSEVVEAYLAGRRPPPPLPWLEDTMSREDISVAKHQQTSARRIVRWDPLWSPSHEPRLP